jgi:NAD(P)-dependent dehydrogenase (short-subunit alcohol dehydrogenase family)
MSERKVAFVTGASSGIGLATAEAFLRKGYATVLADRDAEGGEAAIARMESIGPCRFVACDVADAASVDSAVAGAVAAFGRIDAAFNAAGIDASAPRCSNRRRRTGIASLRST